MTTPGRRIAPACLALGASAYALQGVVVAYLFNFNKGYMTAAGVLPHVAGWVQSVALLALVLKFLGGPVSDRFSLFGLGHRRPYIGLGLLGQSLGLLGLAVVDPGRHLGGFATLAVVAVAGLGLYDTCCDGLIVDATPAEDRSRVQGILWGARFLAATAGTLGFGLWLDHLGGPAKADRVLLACAALGLAPLALLGFVAEPRLGDAERFDWSALRVMVRPRSLALLGFGSLYGVAAFGVEANLSLFYANRGFGPGGDVGLLGAARYLGRAVGALLLPLAMSRLGRRRAVDLGIGLLAATTALQALATTRPSAAALGFAFGLANGWCDALFGVLAMEAADPRLAASTFALFMAVSNLISVGDAAVSEAVRASGGRYGPAFAGAAVVALASWPLAAPLRRPGPRP